MPLTMEQLKALLENNQAMLERIQKLFPDKAERSAFTALLIANNPSTANEESARKGFDVIITSVERRVKSNDSDNQTLHAVFNTLSSKKSIV